MSFTIDDAKDALNKKTVVYGKIQKTINEGWSVSLHGLKAFLPLSQLSVFYKDNPEDCVGKIFPFFVTEVKKTDRDNSVIVSYREYRSYKKDKIKELKPGQIIKCTITIIADKGIYAYFDKGIKVFFPARELPRNYRTCFEKRKTIIGIVILKNETTCQVYLSYNQLQKRGQVIKGIINKVTDIKVFVSFQNGLWGILNRRGILNHSTSCLKVDDELEVKVLGVNYKKMCLSLGVRQIEEEKERKAKEYIKSIAGMFKPGVIYDADFSDISGNNVLVRLSDGITGIIKNSDLAGGRKSIEEKLKENPISQAVFLREDDGKLYFSTKLLTPEEFNPKLLDYDTEELLVEMNIKVNSFVAKVLVDFKSRMSLNYLYADSEEDKGKLLCSPLTGKTIFLPIEDDYKKTFEEGKYYRIRVKIQSQEQRRIVNNPYLFELDPTCLTDGTLVQVSDPYERLVKQTFKKQTSPSSNASLANLLKEVGQNMYDSKERMFFELLQNADDASAEHGVAVNLESVKGYLVLTHNGLPFDRKDFVSITSAARSTKTGSKKKTGYKGIGFKSVFTSSTRVLIKTGGFFFTFNKENPLFKDFDQFYFTVNDISDPDKQKEYLERFSDERDDFKEVDSIPWQLLPEWTQNVPADLQNSIFNNRKNVCIALAMPDGAKTDYLTAIKNVLQEPKFMLFLRNTNVIKFKEEDFPVSLKKQKDGEKVSISTSLPDYANRLFYVVREAELVSVNSDSFASCGVDIVVKTVDNIRTQKKERIFVDCKDEKIASIPSRIAETDNTLISYAIALDEQGQYTPLTQSTTLFAYLPMTETRYPFPFYINADFIMKSSREGVQSDNPWNFFLFYNIGREYISWIGQAASVEQTNYLTLLVLQYFDEKTVGMTELSHFFNQGYKEALHEEEFILNDRGELVKMNQIMLDHTDLAKVIGADDFCELIGKESKRLPHPTLNTKPLEADIFDEIEIVKSVDSILKDKTKRKYFRDWMQDAMQQERDGIYQWLIKRGDKNLVRVLPLFEFNGRYWALEELTTNNFLFLNDKTLPLASLLRKMNFACYDDDITKHMLFEPFLKHSLLDGYEVDVVRSIMEKSSLRQKELKPEEKALLYKVISTLCREYKLTDELETWPLFCNRDGVACPVGRLIIEGADATEEKLLSSIIIDKDEYESAKSFIASELMRLSEVYPVYLYPQWTEVSSKWMEMNTAKNWNVSDQIQIYTIVKKYYDSALAAAKHAAKSGNEEDNYSLFEIKELKQPFILLNGKFVLPSDVFYQKSLVGDSMLYNVCSKLFSLPLPDFETLGVYKSAPFTLSDSSVLSQDINSSVNINLTEVTRLLDCCKEHKEKFFEKKKIIMISATTYNIKGLQKGEWQFYSNSGLAPFILSHCNAVAYLPEVFKSYKNEPGVLSGEDLFEKVFALVDVEACLTQLLPIVLMENRDIKSIFVKNLAKVVIKADDISNGSIFTRLFGMLAELHTKDSTYEELRKKIFVKYAIEGKEESCALSEVSLQGTVTMGKNSYDFAYLYPADEVIQQRVTQEILDKLRQYNVSDSFLKALFKLESTLTPEEVYADMCTNTVLENGVQLAFVLAYCDLKSFSSRSFKIRIDDRTTLPLQNSCWFLKTYSFLSSQNILPKAYRTFLNYYDIKEQKSLPLGVVINGERRVLSYIKANLSSQEISDLLNYIYNSLEQNIVRENINNLKKSLCINDNILVVSAKYALESEKLPSDVLNWVNGDFEKQKYLCNLFNLVDDSSDVVALRRYFTEGYAKGSEKFVLGDKTLQKKLCEWIVEKKLCLEERLLGNLEKVIDSEHLGVKINNDVLAQAIQAGPNLKIHEFSIFKIDDMIPRLAYLPLNANYEVARFKRGNYAIKGKDIFVNSEEWDNLHVILQKIAANPSNSFDAEDYLSFMGSQETMPKNEADRYKREIAILKDRLERYGLYATTEEEDWAAPDNEIKRKALSDAKDAVLDFLSREGYDISRARDNGWTLIDGVYKNGEEFPLVVRSYKDNTRYFALSSFDWDQLMKSENSMLFIYTRYGCQCLSFFDLLRNTKDRISFSFDTVNFDQKDRISALAEILRYFKGLHFDFGSLKPTAISVIQRFNVPEKELKEALKGDSVSLLPM